MKHTKPGSKLSQELRAVIDPIYLRDLHRYRNLCRWVWWQQSLGASDESIRNCISMADKHLDHVGDWWAYLTKIMPKASAKAHEQENDDYKREERRFLDAILDHCRPKKRIGF